MTPRLLWLIFALLVALLVFVPPLLAADPDYWICKDGYCVMSDEVFRILIELARGGKGCA